MISLFIVFGIVFIVVVFWIWKFVGNGPLICSKIALVLLAGWLEAAMIIAL